MGIALLQPALLANEVCSLTPNFPPLGALRLAVLHFPLGAVLSLPSSAAPTPQPSWAKFCLPGPPLPHSHLPGNRRQRQKVQGKRARCQSQPYTGDTGTPPGAGTPASTLCARGKRMQVRACLPLTPLPVRRPSPGSEHLLRRIPANPALPP